MEELIPEELIPIIHYGIAGIFYVVLAVFILFIIKSPWFKGIVGKFTVNIEAKMILDKEKYHLIKNVTLPTEDGTTQIDHIIVSEFGVFVVEIKNMKGWIFGGPSQETWTQKFHKQSIKFQNPLHQNCKHTKTLQALLGLSDRQLFSVIVFVGDSTFKTDMPENVVYGRGYVRFINSKNTPVLTDSQVKDAVIKIKTGGLAP